MGYRRIHGELTKLDMMVAPLWVPKTYATWAYAPRRPRVIARAWRLVAGLHAGGRAMILGLWA
jgi:hypothetical protein